MSLHAWLLPGWPGVRLWAQGPSVKENRKATPSPQPWLSCPGQVPTWAGVQQDCASRALAATYETGRSFDACISNVVVTLCAVLQV